jgi:hypothetical protein
MSDQRRVCPEHPERPSAGTCHRCGRFACQACFGQETGLCITCASRFADPLGVRSTPFSIGRTLVCAWKLFLAEPAASVGVAVAMLCVPSTSTLALPLIPREVHPATVLGTAAVELIFASYLFGILLARMAGAAEGEPVPLLQALRRTARAWPRLLRAQAVVTVLTALGGVLLVAPGVYAAVVLWAVFPIAYLEPTASLIATSAELTRGQRWGVFAMILISHVPLLAIMAVRWEVYQVIARSEGSISDHMTLLTITWTGLHLARQLVESFIVAVVLAGYYGLRRARELDATTPAPGGAPTLPTYPGSCPGCGTA